MKFSKNGYNGGGGGGGDGKFLLEMGEGGGEPEMEGWLEGC